MCLVEVEVEVEAEMVDAAILTVGFLVRFFA